MASQPAGGNGTSAISSSSFIPRPFPPPSLQDIPEEYIVLQLHRLAPTYWSKPETADCTIIVPCDTGQQLQPGNSRQRPTPDPLTTGLFCSQSQTSRRDSATASVNNRRIIVKLHQDYLAAQSTFMRTLLSGSSLLDLSTPVTSPAIQLETSASSSQPPRLSTPHLVARPLPIHSSRQPRILPSSTSHHPVIFLPVPDSDSFPHLIHYIYFGTFDYIEECLHRGIITWQGIVRNVEYLGMRVELKASLGKYFRQWLRPNTPTQGIFSSAIEDGDDDDTRSDVSNGSETSDNSDQSPDQT